MSRVEPERRFRAAWRGVAGHAATRTGAEALVAGKQFALVTDLDTGERWILIDGAWRATIPEPPKAPRPAVDPERWPQLRPRADIDG